MLLPEYLSVYFHSPSTICTREFGCSYVFRCDINYPLEGRKMEYVIGVILTLAVAAFAAFIGFDRERAFYPTVLIVIASYYALFAAMGASTRTLIIEIVIASAFLLVAILGYRISLWI